MGLGEKACKALLRNRARADEVKVLKEEGDLGCDSQPGEFGAQFATGHRHDYNVYGPQTSVTEIINRLQRDKNNWTLNPNLQI